MTHHCQPRSDRPRPAEQMSEVPRIFIALELDVYSFSERNGYGGEAPVKSEV